MAKMNYDDYAPRDDWRESPLFQKAEEIRNIVARIVTISPEDGSINDDYEKDWFTQNTEYMMQNAYTIGAKIAGAWDEDQLYDLKMENAAIIRKAARELITDARGLQICGYKEIEYLDLLRTEVDAFRILFAEWVKTFDINNYNIDRWGLFNPPGVHYDDHDPDDDIPFDPSDYFDDTDLD